ncbi:MAG: DegT/DnrJ/EryC1/StrS family aminotransferase [Bacteroidota bacterium]
MNIPLLDLNRQYSTIKKEIDDAILSVVQNQQFIMGPVVTGFEQQVGDYLGLEHVFGCASGSDALLLALMAMDIKPGDAVITSPFTFFATGGAIARLGAIPVFLDIERDSYNLDPDQVSLFMEGNHALNSKLSVSPEQVRAIMPVHLYGQSAHMEPLRVLSQNYGLSLIEDAAQAIGARYNNQQVGGLGDFGCFSFFPSKNLGAFGDAGLITVKDPELAEKVRILRLHGAKPKYYHHLVGINSRLDAIQAAVLSVKLNHLDNWSNQRIKLAHRYNDLFHDIGITHSEKNQSCSCGLAEDCSFPEDRILLPEETTGNIEYGGRHIYHQYTISTQKRDELKDFLTQRGIGTNIYYPVPLHVQTCFGEFGYEPEDCPNAMCASRQALSLPIFPELTFEEQNYVVSSIKDFFNNV